MSAAAPSTERRGPRARPRRQDAVPHVVRGQRGRARGARVDSRARLPELPDDARHRDRRRLGHRDDLDHSGLERHDRRAVRGPRRERRHRAVVHVARGVSRGPHRAAHGGRLQPDSLPRRWPRVDHADHADAGASPLGLEGHGDAGHRLDVCVSGSRAVLHDARPVHLRQRQRDAPPRRRDRRAGARRLVVARESARRVHPVQRRMAQDHRPARGEGRDLRPEPGQSAHHSVQHARELAGQPAPARSVDSAHDSRFGRARQRQRDDHAALARGAQPGARRRGRFPRPIGPAASGHGRGHSRHASRSS